MSGYRAGLPARAWAAFVLGLIFLRELALSSVLVARTAFAPNIDIVPAIIAVPLDLRTDFGVALVANLVSLTPGTTSLHTSTDGKILYVHALDAVDDEAVIASIKNTFEKWVRKVEGAS